MKYKVLSHKEEILPPPVVDWGLKLCSPSLCLSWGSLGPCVPAHQCSQGISSGLQPDSCKLLNDSHERGLSWINCPGSSHLVSAALFSAAVLGCSKVIPASWCWGENLCNALCCRSCVACSLQGRCVQQTLCFLELDLLFHVGSEVQPCALGGKAVYSPSLQVGEVVVSSYQKT